MHIYRFVKDQSVLYSFLTDLSVGVRLCIDVRIIMWLQNQITLLSAM